MSRVLVTVVGLFLLLLLTLAAFGVDPVQGLKLIFEGAFGDKFGVARTVVRTVPLLLCGLGMAVAWRSGMYNVGGEGQYVMGGLFGATATRALLSFNPGASSVATLLTSALGGCLLAWFAGWLQVKRGVQCVISTILMNFIALQFLGWAVRGPLQEVKHQLPQSDSLASTTMLQRFDPQTDLHSGVFVALIVSFGIWLYLNWTKPGFLQKIVGQNPRMARSNLIDSDRVQMGAMALSGALCGLAGGIDYLGLIGHVGDGFAQGWGFMAIPVALLGGLNVAGVVGSSLFFGALMAGGEGLARFNSIGTTLVYVIQACAVLGFVGLSKIKRKEVVIVD